MNSSWLWLTWTISGREIRVRDAMNSSSMCMIWSTLGHELKALDSMNNSRLWLTWKTWDHHLRALIAMNSSRLWLRWTSPGCELEALYCMNSPCVDPGPIHSDGASKWFLGFERSIPDGERFCLDSPLTSYFYFLKGEKLSKNKNP